MVLSTEEKLRLKLIKDNTASNILDDYNLKDANGKRAYTLKQISEKHNKSKNSIYRILNKYESVNIEGAEVNWRTKSKQPILLEDIVEEPKVENKPIYFSSFSKTITDYVVNPFVSIAKDIKKDAIDKAKRIKEHLSNNKLKYAIGTGIASLAAAAFIATAPYNKPKEASAYRTPEVKKVAVQTIKQEDIKKTKEKIAQKVQEKYQEHKKAQKIKYDPNSVVDTLKQKGMNSDFESRELLWNALTRHEGEYKRTDNASQNNILRYNIKDKTRFEIEKIVSDYLEAPKKVVSEKPLIKEVVKEEMKALNVQDKSKYVVVPKQRQGTLEQYVLNKDKHMQSDILLNKKFENWDFDENKYKFFVDSESYPLAIVVTPKDSTKLEFGKALSGESLYREINTETAKKLKDKIVKEDMFNESWSTLKILKNKQGEVVGYAFSPLFHITNERLDDKVRLHNLDFTKYNPMFSH